MSKSGNIFQVFSKDSDDEQEDKKVAPDLAKRPSKKERRADDQQKREAYGDTVVHDPYQKAPRFDGPKNKGDYAPGEKRPYERRSGTGQPAFARDFKKGGHGKGNVGAPEKAEDLKDLKALKDDAGLPSDKQAQAEAPTPKAEPPEEIITVDQYLAKAGRSYDFKPDASPKLDSSQVKVQDKTVKVLESKAKDLEPFAKKTSKNRDNFAVASDNPLLVNAGSSGNLPDGRRNKGSKRNIKADFNEHTFPALE